MRLYGRKFMSRFVQKKLGPTTETRDAIIFDIDWTAFVCKCKIQGSDEYVNAYFPRNEATIPSWMRLGNSVRVLHLGGVRGHMEVIGPGGARPTPMPGSPSHPPQAGLADAVISGLEVTAAGGLTVEISTGTYRIDGDVYTVSDGSFGYFLTDETDPPMETDETYPPAETDQDFRYIETSETDPPMETNEALYPAVTGETVMEYALDPLYPDTAGQFRYDTFQVGIDGILDYVKGVQVYGTAPLKPVISGNHVQVGEYILIYSSGGTTAITDANIGMEWTAVHGAGLSVTYTDHLDWDDYSDYPEVAINVKVINQYGYLYADARTFTLTMVMGTGLVWSAESGYDAAQVSHSVSGGEVNFKYQRDQTLDTTGGSCLICETSPSIRIQVTGGYEEFITIQLYNKDGYEIQFIGAVKSLGFQPVSPDEDGDVDIDWHESGSNVEVLMDQDIDITLTGASHGDKLVLLLRQDSTGGWVPTLPANVAYGDQITAVNLSISTVANSRTYLGFIYDYATASYDLVANVSGYV